MAPMARLAPMAPGAGCAAGGTRGACCGKTCSKWCAFASVASAACAACGCLAQWWLCPDGLPVFGICICIICWISASPAIFSTFCCCEGSNCPKDRFKSSSVVSSVAISRPGAPGADGSAAGASTGASTASTAETSTGCAASKRARDVFNEVNSWVKRCNSLNSSGASASCGSGGSCGSSTGSWVENSEWTQTGFVTHWDTLRKVYEPTSKHPNIQLTSVPICSHLLRQGHREGRPRIRQALRHAALGEVVAVALQALQGSWWPLGQLWFHDFFEKSQLLTGC